MPDSNPVTRVVVVDDSAAVRKLLCRLLESDPAITVVGTAKDGLEALQVIKEHSPDIVTMDLMMPDMNGLDATREIMSSFPVPIVIVTSDTNAATQSFRMIEAGAVAVIDKPPAPGHPDHAEMTSTLIKTVKSLKGIKLVRRVNTNRQKISIPLEVPTVSSLANSAIQCIAIGASTGGPAVIKQLVDLLPADYPLPILLSQHMAYGFLSGFATWLRESGTLKIEIATQGQTLAPGTLYLAPDDWHMGVHPTGKILLTQTPKEYGLRPAVSVMFRSVASVYGKHAVGILLTGMGADGALELGRMRAAGALTIAQDKESSAVHGMPGVAIQMGHADLVLSPEKIAEKLLTVAKNSNLVHQKQ